MKKFLAFLYILSLGVLVGLVASSVINGDKIEFKPREKYSISIGDTTLQVIRKIKIGDEDSKVLDIRTIYPGKNCYYFQLNEDVELDVVVMR